MAARTWVSLALALLASGCLGSPAPQPTTPLAGTEDGASAPAATGFEVALRGCTLAGGHTLYNLVTFESYLPDPWVAADVRDDVGDPLLLTMGNPNLGHGIAGIFHAALVCDTWSLGGEEHQAFRAGFLGVRVEQPAFDPGDGDHGYIVAVLGFDAPEVREAFVARGLHASEGTASVAYEGPLLHAMLDTAEHGVDDAYWLPEDAGAVPQRVVRLWMVVDASGHAHGEGPQGTLVPRSLDLVMGPSVKFLAPQGQAYYSHTRTHDHEPLPGGYGNAAGLAFTGFDAVLRVGPAPTGVALPAEWHH